MAERGQIRNREQGTQVRDFSGLRYGKITATDIDGLIEYHGLGFIFIETKYGDTELPFGQRLALERLIDDLKKPAIGVIAEHYTDGDIDVAQTQVREYRYQGRWRKPPKPKTCRQLVDCFTRWLDLQKN